MSKDDELQQRARAIENQVAALPSRTVPAMRPIRRETSAAIRAWPAEAVVRLALEIIRRGRVPRWIAFELVANHKRALASLDTKTIEQLGTGNASWQEVDSFGCDVTGPVWRAGQVPDAAVHRWARSKDRWWRRTALVSTVPLNLKSRGGSGDARRTLAVCDLLLDDRDDMVVKALSWALRTLSVRAPADVERYLKRHSARLASRVVREVTNKLDTGLKNP
ncbi:MAG: hypothetical protein DWQ37_03610 [Planctomycetota bacterium]|nr:MAG: hypothetical protein DWQ37_03610 [Planctomycetota bacterium]